MILIILLTLYALLAGLFSGWRQRVKMRRASPPDEVLLAWQAAPSSAMRVDPLVAVSLSLHGAGVTALGVLQFVVTLAAWGQKENWFLRGRDALAVFLMLSLLILSWDFIGRLLGQPLLGLIKVPANFAIGEHGLYYGAALQTWGHFSHYSRDPIHHEVRLHPANCPDLVTFSLNPPTRDGYEQLLKLVAKFLPGSPPAAGASGMRSRWNYFGLLMLTVVPFLVVGVWMAALPGVLSVLYFGLSGFAATRLGGKVIRRYT